jgi:hypothetical protein
LESGPATRKNFVAVMVLLSARTGGARQRAKARASKRAMQQGFVMGFSPWDEWLEFPPGGLPGGAVPGAVACFNMDNSPFCSGFPLSRE